MNNLKDILFDNINDKDCVNLIMKEKYLQEIEDNTKKNHIKLVDFIKDNVYNLSSYYDDIKITYIIFKKKSSNIKYYYFFYEKYYDRFINIHGLMNRPTLDNIINLSNV